MNIRWNVILGVIALCALAWFYSLNQETADLSKLVKKPDSPDYVGYKMETTVFFPDGKKQYLALSDKIEHYTVNEQTLFTAPLVYLYPTTSNEKEEEKNANQNVDFFSTQSWKLSANQARLTKDQILYLEGNVVVQNLTSDSRLQRIETESAVVNLKTQDMTSETQVKIKGKNFSSTGLKLVGNLRQQVATLKEQVKTYYEVSKQ